MNITTTYRAAQAVIVWVPVASLTPAEWNPSNRTTKAAVRSLVQSIQSRGWIDHNAVKLGCDGPIGDGHRRWTAAKIAGLNEITAIFCQQTALELWALNIGQRAIANAQWMSVYATGKLSSDELPPQVRTLILELEQLIGKEGLKFLSSRGTSPTIMQSVDRVRRYTRKIERDFLRRTVYWLVKHDMTRAVINATRTPKDEFDAQPIDPRTLIAYIESDKPIGPLRWE